VGYVPTIDGKKAKMWLETGWDEKNFAFIVRLKLLDPDTGQPLGLPEPKDQLETMDVDRPQKEKDISREIRKLGEDKEEEK
jgi:hypothetical protein